LALPVAYDLKRCDDNPANLLLGVPGSADAKPAANNARSRPKATLARAHTADNGADIAFMTASSFCRRHRGAVAVRRMREKLFAKSDFSHIWPRPDRSSLPRDQDFGNHVSRERRIDTI
jgi:hypothetical protein